MFQRRLMWLFHLPGLYLFQQYWTATISLSTLSRNVATTLNILIDRLLQYCSINNIAATFSIFGCVTWYCFRVHKCTRHAHAIIGRRHIDGQMAACRLLIISAVLVVVCWLLMHLLHYRLDFLIQARECK